MSVKYSVEQDIGFLRLNSPPANTMTMEFFSALEAVLRVVETAKLKALIITGTGRHFSAGADIAELLKMVDEKRMLAHSESFHAIQNLGIPVISAIRGVCLGAAFELALHCNFRICAHDAVIGMPESSFNLMPGVGGIKIVTNLAGRAKAMELILGGTTFSAEEAMDSGLVDVLFAKENLMVSTIQFARYLPDRFFPEHRTIYLKKYFNSTLINA